MIRAFLACSYCGVEEIPLDATVTCVAEGLPPGTSMLRVGALLVPPRGWTLTENQAFCPRCGPPVDLDLDLDLLAKLASGEGGERTGALRRAGYLEWTVTEAGLETEEPYGPFLRWWIRCSAHGGYDAARRAAQAAQARREREPTCPVCGWIRGDHHAGCPAAPWNDPDAERERGAA